MSTILIYLATLVFSILIGREHGYPNISQTTQKATCVHSTADLVASTGPHLLEQGPHQVAYSFPCATPFSRPPLSGQTSTSSLWRSWTNDGIVAMPSLLEDIEWEVSPLSSLWRQMGQGARYLLCATRPEDKRIAPQSWTRQIAACEKCAVSRSTATSTASSTQWFRGRQEEPQTAWTEEAAKRGTSSICSSGHAASLESIWHYCQGSCLIHRDCRDDSGRDSGDDDGSSICIHRFADNAGAREEDGGQVRDQNYRTASKGNASHNRFHQQGTQTSTSAARCPQPTSKVMAFAPFQFDEHIGKADRGLRESAEGLPGSYPEISQRDSNIQACPSATEFSSCRDCNSGGHHRGGRTLGTASTGCRGSGIAKPRQQNPQEVLQSINSQRSDRVVRRRSGGNGPRAAQAQAPTLMRAWWCLVIVGSGYPSLSEIEFHVPLPTWRSDAGHTADAYGAIPSWIDCHAACQVDSSESFSIWTGISHELPLHSVHFDPGCLHPFMAIHDAFLLQQQCHAQDASSLTSRSNPAQRLPLQKTRQTRGRTVILSPHIEVLILSEDEVGTAQTFFLHEGALHSGRRKPWARRPNTDHRDFHTVCAALNDIVLHHRATQSHAPISQEEDGTLMHYSTHGKALHHRKLNVEKRRNLTPTTNHLTDEHSQGAYGSFYADYGHGEQRQAPHLQDIRLQPAFIQDLETAMHQYGEVDGHTGARSMNVLSWYLHGHRLRECRRSRTVRLFDDFLQWPRLLQNAWAAELDPGTTVEFHVVSPDPPIAFDDEDHAAQIILTQQEHPHESAILFTNVYHSIERVALQRLACFGPAQLDRTTAITLATVPATGTAQDHTGILWLASSFGPSRGASPNPTGSLNCDSHSSTTRTTTFC